MTMPRSSRLLLTKLLPALPSPAAVLFRRLAPRRWTSGPSMRKAASTAARAPRVATRTTRRAGIATKRAALPRIARHLEAVRLKAASPARYRSNATVAIRVASSTSSRRTRTSHNGCTTARRSRLSRATARIATFGATGVRIAVPGRPSGPRPRRSSQLALVLLLLVLLMLRSLREFGSS